MEMMQVYQDNPSDYLFHELPSVTFPYYLNWAPGLLLNFFEIRVPAY